MLPDAIQDWRRPTFVKLLEVMRLHSQGHQGKRNPKSGPKTKQEAKKEIEELFEIKVEKINTKLPSPFALNLILQGYADLLKIEDKIAFLKRMHELHLESIK